MLSLKSYSLLIHAIIGVDEIELGTDADETRCSYFEVSLEELIKNETL